MTRLVYLDHAATTPLAPHAREAMEPFLDDRFGNASSVYAAGREARKAVDDAREQVAAAVGARADEVVFTSGGTEADNLALKGAALRARHSGRDGVVVSAIEHQAVLESARWLATQGFRVATVAVGANGVVDVAALEAAVDAKTAVVSVMAANNEVGTVQPVAECARIARAAGAVFHADAVQALPWIPVRAPDADLIALSAHKVGGPKGVGALVRRRGTGLEPLLHGGGQERGLRSGTYDVAGIVGFGAAVAARVERLEETSSRVRAVRDRLERALLSGLPDTVVNASDAERLPNSVSVCLAGVESETLLLLLDGAGVAASSGSACHSGATEPSHVLLAMGVPKERALGALRLTLGPDTTEDDVDEAAAQIVQAARRVRR